MACADFCVMDSMVYRGIVNSSSKTWHVLTMACADFCVMDSMVYRGIVNSSCKTWHVLTFV